ncbi:hypothetical protein [Cellulomonas pakistanensis]|uniref:Cardiolipin synthase N-terminal domain-containing protein n=1 Tax=Cellulomonas pakistanensis TaxID=992287 RepID=A0A919U5Y0_9CELL|nr:hypothetical protein [Cellulomonas pakistanensis]GIG36459.1 hypothetical protein Cpa01nite_18400 [Cellulomonas pakistanensis]
MHQRDTVEGWRLLLPAPYDLLWSAALVVLVGLTVAAVLVWSRRREPASSALGTLALIVLVPVLGPATYLAAAALDRRAEDRAAAPPKD